MKRKIKSDSGFTLAELLIVVAIIGVLVAIAIPIFTGQLEKSREAVDLSDVRSAYAEVMMAAITGDTSAMYTKNSSTIYDSQKNIYTITVSPLKQQKEGWDTPLPITIGGVSSAAGSPYWVGSPGPNGSCVITYYPPVSGNTEYVSFVWSGGTDNGNNNQPAVTPTPTPTLIPMPTQAPTPTPEITTKPNTPTNDWNEVINRYGNGDWPDKGVYAEVDFKYGQIIKYGNDYYVVANPADYVKTFSKDCYWVPDVDTPGELIKISKNVHNWTELDSDGNIPNSHLGDTYIAEDGRTYIYKADYPGQKAPTGAFNPWAGPWILVSKN